MKYYFLLHNSLNTKGENGIILRATEKKKSKYFSLGISTKEKYWDSKKKKVKKADIMHQMKNQIIDAFDLKAQRTILEYIVKDQPLTLIKFIEALTENYNGAYTSFFEYATIISKKKQKELTKTTYNNYQFQYNKLEEFKNDFALVDVDKAFINKYVGFLKETKKNQYSTISKSLTYLRMILKEALDERLIEKSPFSDYKIKEIKSKDDF